MNLSSLDFGRRPTLRGPRSLRGLPLALGRSACALAALLVAPLVAPLAAQGAAPRADADSTPRPVEFNSRGLVFNGSDGFSYFALRFRIQQWASFATEDGQPGIAHSQLFIRRSRLRFQARVWDPRFTADVQLSFARGDLDFENSGIPNILRDAVVRWQATPRLELMGGQTKLPGNRQRVMSSGDQQFPDRSIVNGTFTLDRDMGLWAEYATGTERFPVVLKGALTSGEGRAVNTGNAGIAYTGRVELLPLGAFLNGGDQFEGDLSREPEPRVAIGLTLSHNEQGQRTGGQLGQYLFAPRDMDVGHADLLLKVRGFSFSTELMRRRARNPITSDGVETRAVRVGSGVTAQAAYLFHNDVEVGARWSKVDPHRSIWSELEAQREMSGVLTRYIRGHRVKMHLEVLRNDFRDNLTGVTRGGWTTRTSFEFGI
jgi:hypothetical protein